MNTAEVKQVGHYSRISCLTTTEDVEQLELHLQHNQRLIHPTAVLPGKWRHNTKQYLEVLLLGDELVVDIRAVEGHKLLPCLSELLSICEASDALAQAVDHLQGIILKPTALLKIHTKQLKPTLDMQLPTSDVSKSNGGMLHFPHLSFVKQYEEVLSSFYFK